MPQSEVRRWESHLLGEPSWWQFREFPPGEWSFFFQLRSDRFGGGGVGHGFLSPDEKEGRFLWQC